MIPFHDWPQGSPPSAVQPVSCDGLFKLRYNTLRAETAPPQEKKKQRKQKHIRKKREQEKGFRGAKKTRIEHNCVLVSTRETLEEVVVGRES